MTGEKLRLFVALELPPDLRAELPDPGAGWRPVAGEMRHVTLAFLGWRPASDVPLVVEAVGGAVRPVQPVSLAGVELLPPRRPRVIAVRIDDPAGSLVALQRSVSDALVSAGVYEPETRAFLPHVTIGRTKERVRARDVKLPALEPISFQPTTVALFRSQPARGGAQYSALERFPLAD